MGSYLRGEIRIFANEMERQLRLNEHKGGWKDCDLKWLYSELSNHLEELKRFTRADSKSTLAYPGKVAILDNAADVANFAMMIADVCGARRRAPLDEDTSR